MEELNEAEICPICRECATDEQRVILKDNDTKVYYHKECVSEYVSFHINYIPMGVPPRIYSPNSNSSSSSLERRSLLDYGIMKNVCSKEVMTRYSKLAFSSLMIKCGGCHTMKSLLVDYLVGPPNSLINVALSKDEINKECQKHTKASEFWSLLLQKLFPDRNMFQWNEVEYILSLVDDPGTRASLQHFYFKNHPRIETRCCQKTHCFNCMTSGFHDNFTCQQVLDRNNSDILYCHACFLPLTKNDGCDAVTCYCGENFSWSQELVSQKNCSSFAQKYPTNTDFHCACELLELEVIPWQRISWKEKWVNHFAPSIHTNQVLPMSWQKRHRARVQIEQMNLWKTLFPHYANQACVLHSLNMAPLASVNLRGDIAKTWKSTHANDIAHCECEMTLSKTIQLSALFEEENSRASFIHNCVLNNNIINAHMWSLSPYVDSKIIKAREGFDSSILSPASLSVLEINIFRSVAFLFSNRRIYNYVLPLPSTELLLCSFRREIPCTSRIVYRENFRVDQLNPNQGLFFGLVNSLGAHFGIVNSISLWDGYVANHAFFNAKKIEIVEGDWISIIFDSPNNILVISVNGNTSYTAMISADDYVDLGLVVQWPSCDVGRNSVISRRSPVYTYSNSLQPRKKEAYTFSMRQLLAVITVMEKIRSHDMTTFDTDNYFHSMAQEFLDKHICSFYDITLQSENMMIGIVHRLNSYLDIVKSFNFQSLASWITWEVLLSGFCWYLVNMDVIDDLMMLELAQLFQLEHEDNALFYAASILSPTQIESQPKSLVRKAKAFAMIYAEDMHEWYDYNRILDESLVPGLERTNFDCRCIPRHGSSNANLCPYSGIA